jgi:2-haloacid dehalogenase
MERIAAVAFDAYGTLFDIHAPTARTAARIGDEARAARLGQIWRDKQLQYTWLRSLSGAYADFWTVTQDALDYALDALKVRDEALRQDLLALYRALDPYPDAVPALERMKARGLKTAVLSNGSPGMLAEAIEASQTNALIDAVLSVDPLRAFKPDPRIYQLAADWAGAEPGRILFVSSNGWDAWCGAAFGFTTVWVNRFGLPEERLPGRPVAVVDSLAALETVLG